MIIGKNWGNDEIVLFFVHGWLRWDVLDQKQGIYIDCIIGKMNAWISRMWKAPNHRHFWFLQCLCRQLYNMITNQIHIFFNVQKELYNH